MIESSQKSMKPIARLRCKAGDELERVRISAENFFVLKTANCLMIGARLWLLRN
jgi:hypothetical protein